jgi:phage baseplate assembly protein W
VSVLRHDYAFPLRIDPASGQAQQVGYERHVAQLVRQVLLTGPGERTDLPEFGCGLRALIFAGNSLAVAATAQILVHDALTRWLAEHLDVRGVEVTFDETEIVVRVEYSLVATSLDQSVELRVS